MVTINEMLAIKGYLRGDFNWKQFLKKQIPYVLVILGLVISTLIGLPEETLIYGIPSTLIIALLKDISNVLKHI
jgi:hypothetical protein